MKDPLSDLACGVPLDGRIRRNISGFYKNRGKKALDYLDEHRIFRYRDFFVVTGDSGDHVVEDDFCSCSDFRHRGSTCAHILAVKIARATGRYTLVDTWYYEEIRNKND
jgi:predicted nucleic acid-binding Zn finger protein